MNSLLSNTKYSVESMSYVDIESWQIAEIKQAITEADAGDFASDEEFNAVLIKHAA